MLIYGLKLSMTTRWLGLNGSSDLLGRLLRSDLITLEGEMSVRPQKVSDFNEILYVRSGR